MYCGYCFNTMRSTTWKWLDISSLKLLFDLFSIKDLIIEYIINFIVFYQTHVQQETSHFSLVVTLKKPQQ